MRRIASGPVFGLLVFLACTGCGFGGFSTPFPVDSGMSRSSSYPSSSSPSIIAPTSNSSLPSLSSVSLSSSATSAVIGPSSSPSISSALYERLPFTRAMREQLNSQLQTVYQTLHTQGMQQQDIAAELTKRVSLFGLDQQGPASSVIHFGNPFSSITFDVPFDSQWLNGQYALAPYEDDGRIIRFGPLVFDRSTLTLERAYTLEILPKRDLRTTLASVVLSPALAQGSSPTLEEIAGMQAIVYDEQSADLSPRFVMELFGQDANYLLIGSDSASLRAVGQSINVGS